MSDFRLVLRLTAIAAVAALAACAAPVPRPSTGSGAIVGMRVLDVMGNLTIRRGVTSEALDGPAAQQTICGCAGVEYDVRLDSGATVTVARELRPGDRRLSVGERVIVQDRDNDRLILPAPNV